MGTSRILGWLAAWIAAASVGCGRDDAAPGIPPSPPYAYPVRPSASSLTLNVGDRAYFPGFVIPIGGSASAFEGKTLHVAVEDPGGILEGDFAVGVDGRTLRFRMTGRVLDSLAPRTGALVFHVCFDAACLEELAGSPSTATYAFAVSPGLVVDAPETLDLFADFGEDLATLEIPLILPANTRGWQVTRTRCLQRYSGPLTGRADCWDSALAVPSQSENGAGPAAIRLDPGLGWPGTYEDEVEVRAYSTLGVDVRVHVRTLPVRYTIRTRGGPDAIFYRIAPMWNERVVLGAEGLDFALSGLTRQYVEIGWYTKAGHVHWDPYLEYAAPPDGADPLAPYARWFSPGAFFEPCDVLGQHCMAAGTYQVTIRGAVLGTGAPVSLPVTMHVP